MGRPQRVVVVTNRPAEHRKHRIADELLAGAIESLDRLAHRHEGGIDPGPDILRIVLGDEADVVDEIGEDGRDDAAIAVLRPGGQRRSGRGAAPCAIQATPTLVAEPGVRPRCCATHAATHWVAVLPFPRLPSSPQGVYAARIRRRSGGVS